MTEFRQQCPVASVLVDALLDVLGFGQFRDERLSVPLALSTVRPMHNRLLLSNHLHHVGMNSRLVHLQTAPHVWRVLSQGRLCLLCGGVCVPLDGGLHLLVAPRLMHTTLQRSHPTARALDATGNKPLAQDPPSWESVIHADNPGFEQDNLRDECLTLEQTAGTDVNYFFPNSGKIDGRSSSSHDGSKRPPILRRVFGRISRYGWVMAAFHVPVSKTSNATSPMLLPVRFSN